MAHPPHAGRGARRVPVRGAGRAAAFVVAALTTFALAWPLGWNRFPLVYWDTSEYLWRWTVVRPGFDRPIFYSLLLGAFHRVPFGLHGVVLLQAAVTAALLVLLARAVFASGTRAMGASVAGAAAIAASPAAFHVCTLMPDVSALWLGLALPLVLLAPRPGIAWGAGAVVALATVWHSSSLLILAALVPVLILAARLAGRSPVRSAWVLGSVLVLQALAFGWNASRAGLGFSPRPTGSEFFLAARLQEGGLLETAFREIASETAPRIPRALAEDWARRLSGTPRSVQGLLWDAGSPLNHDFPAWRDEVSDYRRATALLGPAVVAGLTRHPVAFGRTGLGNAWEMASGRHLLAGFVPHGEDSGVQRVLAERWSRELERYQAGRQGREETPVAAFPRYMRLWTRGTSVSIAIASLLGLGLAVAALRGRPCVPGSSGSASAAALLLCALVLADVVACGMFSMASSRYVERVVALPLLALVFLAFAWKSDRGPRPRPAQRS